MFWPARMTIDSAIAGSTSWLDVHELRLMMFRETRARVRLWARVKTRD